MKKLMIALLCVILAGCSRSSNKQESKQLYNPGTYTYVSTGEYGDMEIEVVLSENAIESITILSSHDTNAILEEVRNTYIADIIALQSVEIDTVAGATGSCRGVCEAVTTILEENIYENNEQD